jgi:hypothetical protein
MEKPVNEGESERNSEGEGEIKVDNNAKLQL